MSDCLPAPESDIDIAGPIDIAAMREAITRLGPLRIWQSGNPYVLVLMVSQCECGQPECQEEVITAHRLVGLSQISWTISPERLKEFKSLEEYFRWAQLSGPESSSGERQIIEAAIAKHLGKPYHEVDHMACVCPKCIEGIALKDLWRIHLLNNLAIALREREEFLDWLAEPDAAKYQSSFDEGFAFGRLAAEYFLKERIEDDALRGLDAAEAQLARTRASGKASSSKREQRIETLLTKMEELVASNPAISRFGLQAVAALALEDAEQENPKLWSQGRSQVPAYLDEMRADLRFRDRFLKLSESA